jgi:zinc transporter 1
MQQKNKILVVISISSAFALLELVIGLKNHSLALLADAFHVSSDIIGFTISYIALTKVQSKRQPKDGYSWGYARAELLGAFFNGTFLAALALSIVLQSIERFIEPSDVLQVRLASYSLIL